MRSNAPGMSPAKMAIAVAVTMHEMAGTGSITKVTGTSISRLLGAVVAIDTPGWLGSERLPPLELTAHQQIWPDGRPFAVVEKFRSAPPLIPELAGARLIRINRRSFRVLDGGLGKG